MFDFCEDAKKGMAKNLLWKVQRLLDELNENAAKMWIPEKWLNIDKQMLGFQGRSRIKLRISYKKEVMGSNVMLSVTTATHSCSTSDMGILPLSSKSSRTRFPTYLRRPSVSSGLLFVFQTFGLESSWTTFSTHRSCSGDCTWRSVLHIELCKRPVVACHRW